MFKVSAYTDGACSGNPGPGGVGVVLLCAKHRKEISRPLGDSTNNRAEIQAVIDALRCLHRPEKTELTLYTDSQLVCGLLTQGWKAKANQDLVAEMRQLAQKCASFQAVKVKGHNGDPLNERADQLARAGLTRSVMFSSRKAQPCAKSQPS